jgi:hypothetical protein
LAFADKDTLTRYLLGELSSEDRRRLENDSLADAKVWENLTTVENDLIDSYARGELSEQQRREFEQHYLDSPEKHERLEMARLLMDPNVRQSIKAASIEEREHHGWLEWLAELLGERHRAMRFAVGAVAVSALAVGAVAAFLLLENRRLLTELGQLQSQQNSLQHQIEQLEQRLRASSSGENDREPAIISALLVPGIPRGPGQQNTSGVLRIPATASWVRLMLDLKRDQYPQYQVVIETPEGNRVNRAEGLTSETGNNGGRIVSVLLASQTLKKGDYVIKLSGQNARGRVEAVDFYSLSVIR